MKKSELISLIQESYQEVLKEAKSSKETAISNVAGVISVIDKNSFGFEYLGKPSTKKINEARKLLFDVLSEHGYELDSNGKSKLKK